MTKLISIALLFWTGLSFGQGDEIYDHGLDQDKWQDIRDGIRYEGQEEGPGREWTYESDEEYQREWRNHESGNGTGNGGNGYGGGGGDGAGQRYDGTEQRPQENYNPPPQNSTYQSPSFGGLSWLGYLFLGVFAVGLIYLIYYLFINAERKGSKIKIGEGGFNIEDVNPIEIPLTELQRLLQEALARKDYRGAVRIYFMFIVRDLAEKKHIKWEKEKTNFHYLREMSGKNEFHDFNVSVSYFEIIWYGKRELDADKFEQVRPNFTQFLDKLGVK
ncbi:MAG: hypothetical protein GQ574_21815 [Crocinitomix sp.]|nr:hypothetical protein [Crocinitomix sp.]